MPDTKISAMTDGTPIQSADLLVVVRSGANRRISPPGPIFGTTTNDSAAAGVVGEIIESTVLVGSAVSLTTATTANVTSISLTAGDWDVFGNVVFNPNVATIITSEIGSIHTTSATLPTVPNGGAHVAINYSTGVTGVGAAYPVGLRRYSLSGTTTIFLVAQSTFTINTNAVYGYLGARRVR